MQKNPERIAIDQGRTAVTMPDGSCQMTYFTMENGLTILAFDTASISAFPTSSEKVFAQVSALPPYSIWFAMNSNGIAIPARIETDGKIYMCNYTGSDLSNINFYGEVIYVRV